MNDKTNFISWEDAVRWLYDQPEAQELVRGAYYDNPLLAAATRYWGSEEWAAIQEWLPPRAGRALDIGAGRGIASFALAKDGFDVTAVEPDDSPLVGAAAIRQLSAEANLAIHVVQEYSEQLPFQDGSFDVVFARAVLHHTQDLRTACREFMRVLVPGGRLIAVREHVISRQADLPVFLATHPLHKLYGGENAFMLNQYCEAISSAGLEICAVIAPLQSPINYAPHTADSLHAQLAKQIGSRIPGTTLTIQKLLGLPGVWPLVRPLLTKIDKRPGRLYSFVAKKP